MEVWGTEAWKRFLWCVPAISCQLPSHSSLGITAAYIDFSVLFSPLVVLAHSRKPSASQLVCCLASLRPQSLTSSASLAEVFIYFCDHFPTIFLSRCEHFAICHDSFVSAARAVFCLRCQHFEATAAFCSLRTFLWRLALKKSSIKVSYCRAS